MCMMSPIEGIVFKNGVYYTGRVALGRLEQPMQANARAGMAHCDSLVIDPAYAPI